MRLLSSRSWFFAALFALALALPVEPALVMDLVQPGKKFIPQGVQGEVLYFRVHATGQDEVINSITIRNTSGRVFFGSKISAAYVFLDANNTGSFKGQGVTQKAVQNFSTPTQTDISFVLSQTVPSNNTPISFFIVYDIDRDANLGATTNVTLVQVKAQSNNTASLTGFTTTNQIDAITGIKSAEVTNVAPTVVAPDQEKVAMLRLKLTVQGEVVESGINIGISNESANFVTGNKTTGITKAYLYEDLGQVGVFDPNGPVGNRDVLLQSTTTDVFSSSSRVTFKSPFVGDSSFKFADQVTRNFYIAYDIGKDFSVSSDTTVKAQLVTFTGTGKSSGETLNSFSKLPKPDDPASSAVAGLVYGTLASAVPFGDSFGAGSIVPMLKLPLTAFQAGVTINQVFLQNKGTAEYINDGGKNGVSRIRIYEDNGNAEFDGINSSDTLIGNLDTGSGNQSDSATVTIQKTVIVNGNPRTGGLLISKFNSDTSVKYPQNNSKIVFVVYDFGVDSRSGNNADVRVENIIGKSLISDAVTTMNLLGVVPAKASPNAEVALIDTQVYWKEVTNIAPSFAVQGEVKVPMLHLDLQSSAAFSKPIFQIANESQSFLSNNLGVSKVWIYRDENKDKKFDSADTLLAATKIDPGASVGTSDLANVLLNANGNQLLVLYDIGQIATVSSKNVRAQLNKVTAGTGETITFGGEVPVPKEAANLPVVAKFLTIPSVTITGVTSESDLANTFNITVRVTNTSTRNVRLTQAVPRFFSGSASGSDVSSQFNFTTIQTFPTTLNAGASLDVIYFTRLTSSFTKGIVLVDGYAIYTVTGNRTALITRYQGSDQKWFSAATTTGQLSLAASEITRYPWTMPAYISSVKVGATESEAKTFQNGDAIAAKSNFYIFLKNKDTLDVNSFAMTLNGVPLTFSGTQGTSANTFSYTSDRGLLTVQDVGSVDGTLTLNLKDVEGQSLETASLSFLISESVVRLDNVLFYPNPYKIGSQALKLGFALTRNATVRAYLFNSVGMEVWRTEVAKSLGYQTIEIDAFSSFLTAGVYVCKIVAEDDSGNKSVRLAKLAIF